MTLTEEVAKNIIRKLLAGVDYRIEVVTMIDAEFLQFAMDFFKKVIEAKINDKNVTADWYKEVFLSEGLPKDNIAINSGLNMKTITNMYNSGTKEIVIDASNSHYDALYTAIENLVNVDNELELTLTLKFKGISVELTISETLIVINTLAVKRAALRGGLWSTAGKRVEKPLMLMLCKLYSVPEANYAIHVKAVTTDTFVREIDFYLCTDEINHKCEVKLMGKGNPESADAVIARASKVFIADKLSDTNKTQLDSLDVCWTELRGEGGFHRFKKTLESLNIPHTPYEGHANDHIDRIFEEIFKINVKAI